MLVTQFDIFRKRIRSYNVIFVSGKYVSRSGTYLWSLNVTGKEIQNYVSLVLNYGLKFGEYDGR